MVQGHCSCPAGSVAEVARSSWHPANVLNFSREAALGAGAAAAFNSIERPRLPSQPALRCLAASSVCKFGLGGPGAEESGEPTTGLGRLPVRAALQRVTRGPSKAAKRVRDSPENLCLARLDCSVEASLREKTREHLSVDPSNRLGAQAKLPALALQVVEFA